LKVVSNVSTKRAQLLFHHLF